jgi:hypothetical protein
MRGSRLLVKWLNKDAISGNAVTSTSVRADTLDRAGNKVRIRQASVVVRADQDSVVYHKHGQFYRAQAKAIVLACGSHTAQHLVEHLADNARKESQDNFSARTETARRRHDGSRRRHSARSRSLDRKRKARRRWSARWHPAIGRPRKSWRA